MILGSTFLVSTLIIAQVLMHICTSVHGKRDMSYVHDACSVTMYPELCVHSLAFYSEKAKHSPKMWARAGVSVSIDWAKNTSQYLMEVNATTSMRGRSKTALLDCIECFQDSLYNLHKSLGVLRKLNEQEFFVQLDDVTTWLSSSLTDDDTCLEGFGDKMEKEVNFVCHMVRNMSCITSNALALVNKLAITGLQSLSP